MNWSSGQRETERLLAMYGEMSEAELLEMRASAADLTEVAQEALAGEMKRRGLDPEMGEAENAAALDPGSFDEDDATGWRTVHVFEQAFEAQAAFRILERELIEFAVEDRSLDENGDPVPGPAVRLALLVEAPDWDRCARLLREEAGLFPEAVVDPRGEPEGPQPEMVTVGEFEQAGDVDAASRALEAAGVTFQTMTHDGEDWERTSIEVKCEDQDRALAVLEALVEEDGA